MSESSRLSRWSQRKLAAKKHGGAIPEPADAAGEAKSPSDAAVPAGGDRTAPLTQNQSLKPNVAGGAPEQAETMLTEADLPSIDRLTAQSDYTVFLKNNVPEALRKAALRKLWVSDPVLANLDGLNDYDDDFTIVTAMTMDDTSYKIGRGLLDDEAKPALEPGTEPALEQEPAQTGDSESLSARAGPDQPQEDSERRSDADDEASNSDAPPVTSSDETRSLDASEPDKAQGSGRSLSESSPDTGK